MAPPSAYRSSRPQQDTHNSWSWLFPFRKHEEIPDTPQPRAEKPTYILQDYLPPPVEDRTIRKLVEGVQEHLHNHVSHFYIDTTTVSNGAYAQPEKPPETKHYAPDLPTQRMGESSSKQEIKRVIAVRLIRGIQPFDGSNEAGILLPHEISNFLMSVPDPARVKNDQAYASILGQWRVFSWYLLSHPEIHPEMRDDNERAFQKRLEREAQTLISNLDEQLQAYIDESKDEARKEDLAQLICRVAELGRTISAQSASYEFSWDYVPEDLEDLESESPEPRKQRRPKGRVADESRRSKPRAHHEYEVEVLFPALLKKSNFQGSRSYRRTCVCEPDLDKLLIKPVRRRTTDQATATLKSAGM